MGPEHERIAAEPLQRPDLEAVGEGMEPAPGQPPDPVVGPALTGEGPLRHLVGAPAALGQRVDEEVGPAEVVEIPVLEGVAEAGRHVVHRPALRRRCRHRQERIDHEVHRDDVEHALGDAGELRQRPPAEGEDDRLRHPEALDPAGVRAGEGALDDRGPDDGERVVARGLVQGDLGQGLGEGVHVRPAEAAGPGTAVLDQAVALPGAPVLLAALGDGLGARPADLRAGPGLEPGQLLWVARVRLDLGPHPEGGVALGSTWEWRCDAC